MDCLKQTMHAENIKECKKMQIFYLKLTVLDVTPSFKPTVPHCMGCSSRGEGGRAPQGGRGVDAPPPPQL